MEMREVLGHNPGQHEVGAAEEKARDVVVLEGNGREERRSAPEGEDGGHKVAFPGGIYEYGLAVVEVEMHAGRGGDLAELQDARLGDGEEAERGRGERG